MTNINAYFELAWQAIIGLAMVAGAAILMGGVLVELWDGSVSRRRRNKIKLLQRENAMLSEQQPWNEGINGTKPQSFKETGSGSAYRGEISG